MNLKSIEFQIELAENELEVLKRQAKELRTKAYSRVTVVAEDDDLMAVMEKNFSEFKLLVGMAPELVLMDGNTYQRLKEWVEEVPCSSTRANGGFLSGLTYKCKKVINTATTIEFVSKGDGG